MSRMSLPGITQLKVLASKKWSWLGRDSGELPENISLCPAVPKDQGGKGRQVVKELFQAGIQWKNLNTIQSHLDELQGAFTVCPSEK